MENQKISVVVPIYNVEDYLEHCIESICQQTYHNLEIILVDDGSTDNSGVICDRYAAYDQRIHIIHQKNSGVVSARKAGLRYANGTYIGFVDGDDYLEPDMYEELLQIILQEQVDFVHSGYYVADCLQAMDCCLLPSRFEGLGIAVVEAVASGLPCLVSDQVPSEVAVTEEVRRVPLNMTDWIDALKEMMQMTIDRRRGVETVRAAGYDVRQQAKVLEKLYKEV